MQAILGKQPSILPNLEDVDANLDDTSTGPEGLSRGRHRLRELACQNMIEVTAQERTKRATRSKTRPAAQSAELAVGDVVEFYRDPSQKEHQGWRGPAEILKVESDGTTFVKWQGGSIICRPQDIRRALIYLALWASLYLADADSLIASLTLVQSYVSQMPIGSIALAAVIVDKGQHILTQYALQHTDIYTYFISLHVGSSLPAVWELVWREVFPDFQQSAIATSL